MHKTKAIIKVLKRKPPTPAQVMRFFMCFLFGKFALRMRLEGSEWCTIDSLSTSPNLTHIETVVGYLIVQNQIPPHPMYDQCEL